MPSTIPEPAAAEAIERSMPPVSTTNVMPRPSVRTTACERMMFCQFAHVRNTGSVNARYAKIAAMPTSTPM